jgi:hypothetical protein
MTQQPWTVESFDPTPEQRLRMATAMAIFDAKRAALRAGMSVAQVEAQTWLVEVDPVQAEAV